VSLELNSKDIATLKSVRSQVLGLAKMVGVQANSKKLTKEGDQQVAKSKAQGKVRAKVKKKSVGDDISKDYLVGIDLGTSRSALVGEDGAQFFVESVVGWPRDIIGIKVMGEAIMYGAEAVKMRESLEISRPLADGVIKEGKGRDHEAVEELLSHLIEKAEVPQGRNICGVIGVPAKASLQSKKLLMEIARKCMHHVMLISEPFAVAYEQKKLNNSIVVDIGAGTTDLCAMKGRIPDGDHQLTINKAGNYVDGVLAEALKAQFPDATITTLLCKKLKEKFGTVLPPRSKIVANLRVEGVTQAHDITDAMVYACSILVPDIVEGIKQLLLSFDPEFEDEVLQNIVLAGGMSQVDGLPAAIEKAFKDFGAVKVNTVKAPLYIGAEGALRLGLDIPVKHWEKMGFLDVDC
jgi:rod shape-determining protein MreB and related proteins